MIEAVVMTVKGRKDLTFHCLATMDEVGGEVPSCIYVVDAGNDGESLVWEVREGFSRFKNIPRPVYVAKPGCGISNGWNTGIKMLGEFYDSKEINIWLLNNDVIFLKPGWLRALSDRLLVPGTGIVGSSAMSVFGHPFATGGIWGFNLGVALSLTEDGKVLDEELNYCCQDVDLSIRMSKAGYVVTHVPGVEIGDDPMIIHLVSQTVYSNEGETVVLEKRKPEFDLLVRKHGRRE